METWIVVGLYAGPLDPRFIRWPKCHFGMDSKALLLPFDSTGGPEPN